jgi:leucyl/phenylalanyl-tRNA--protein transferase
MVFPPVDHAEPDGLLAVGGDLTTDRLLLAYQSGIFPWYSDDQPILWFSPDPRFVLFPEDLKVANSLRRIIKAETFTVTYDTAFDAVIENCRSIERVDQPGTWITEDMAAAYCDLHKAGHAHSVEVWQNKELVGGLYGVTVGKCFCGESMFAQASNASKVGFVWLVDKLKTDGFNMIDCQMPTDHLAGFGAKPIPRNEFLAKL